MMCKVNSLVYDRMICCQHSPPSSINFYCGSTQKQNIDENELIVCPTLKICVRTCGLTLNGNFGSYPNQAEIRLQNLMPFRCFRVLWPNYHESIVFCYQCGRYLHIPASTAQNIICSSTIEDV